MRAHGTGSASKAIENKRDESGVRQTVNDGSFLNGVCVSFCFLPGQTCDLNTD